MILVDWYPWRQIYPNGGKLRAQAYENRAKAQRTWNQTRKHQKRSLTMINLNFLINWCQIEPPIKPCLSALRGFRMRLLCFSFHSFRPLVGSRAWWSNIVGSSRSNTVLADLFLYLSTAAGYPTRFWTMRQGLSCSTRLSSNRLKLCLWLVWPGMMDPLPNVHICTCSGVCAMIASGIT